MKFLQERKMCEKKIQKVFFFVHFGVKRLKQRRNEEEEEDTVW